MDQSLHVPVPQIAIPKPQFEAQSGRPQSIDEVYSNAFNGATTASALGQTIEPPAPRPKQLVLCFDGTGNKFTGDDTDSNILKIFRMLDRSASDQYHYYQPGIGTYVDTDNLSDTSLFERFSNWYSQAKDAAVGSSFDTHVIGGYRFLMRFYSPDDEIYVFGFSRGAYTARFLCEMLDHVGLLPHGNEEMVLFAWRTFSQWQCRSTNGTAADKAKAREMFRFMKGFRETFSRPVRRVQFLGLFDTVNSVPRFETAWMQRSKFPYTARSSALVIRHAVSINERRAKFRQDLIYQQRKHSRQHHNPLSSSRKEKEEEKERGRQPSTQELETEDDPQADRFRCPSQSRVRGTLALRTSCDANNADCISTASRGPLSDAGFDAEEDAAQDIDEVWFAGGHGDIGGGWETQPHSKNYSHVPLVWMVREARKAGLRFDVGRVFDMGCADASSPPDEIPAAQAIPNIEIGRTNTEELEKDASNETYKSKDADATNGVGSTFHEVVSRAQLARLHDSLDFKCGMSKRTVLSWRFMEYLPFRRMDLQEDGSWKPIRWPLPRGEVRDIPRDARIHGSVIRRMKMDEKYRPGNLIVGGGGRGCRAAPKKYGMGEWVCVAEEGDPVGEKWVRKDSI